MKNKIVGEKIEHVLEDYFKTDMIFHNSFLDSLETAIETNTNLTEKQKDDLIIPLYQFYEYPKNLHNKQDKIIRSVRIYGVSNKARK